MKLKKFLKKCDFDYYLRVWRKNETGIDYWGEPASFPDNVEQITNYHFYCYESGYHELPERDMANMTNLEIFCQYENSEVSDFMFSQDSTGKVTLTVEVSAKTELPF